MKNEDEFFRIVDTLKNMGCEPVVAASPAQGCLYTYNGHCPTHDDKSASFTTSLSIDGKILSHCHAKKAACTHEMFMEAMGTGKTQQAQKAKKKRDKTKRKIAKTYPYVNLDGNVVSETVRYEPKSFSQRRPDPDKPGKYIWNLKGIKTILYCLPELQTETHVILVEGEKDVDRLRKIGVPATTNPMGKDAWQEQYTDTLIGKTVYVLPDNDPPEKEYGGQKHGLNVAEILHLAGVKTYLLPPFDGVKDVSDWFDNGGTKEQFKEILKNTELFDPENLPEWTQILEVHRPPATDSPEPVPPPYYEEYAPRNNGKSTTIRLTKEQLKIAKTDIEGIPYQNIGIIAKEFGETIWAWEPWLPCGLLTMIVADAGVGKTRFCFDLAKCFTTGENWPDTTEVKPEFIGDILWIEAEGMHGVNANTVKKMGIPEKKIIMLPLEDTGMDAQLDDPEHWKLFIGMAQLDNIKAIFIDSLSGAYSFDENKILTAKPICQQLSALAKWIKKPIIITHHVRKSGQNETKNVIEDLDRVRGSSAFKQFMRVIIAMDKPDPQTKTKRIHQIKNNMKKKPEPMGIIINEENVEYVDVPSVIKTKTKQQQIIERTIQLLEETGGVRASKEILIHLSAEGFKYDTVSSARDKMRADKIIKVDSTHKSFGGVDHWEWTLIKKDETQDEEKNKLPF